jgi:hypothetical protein
MYEWFVFALSLDAVWLVLYALKPNLRRQMLWVSAFTTLTGLAEPIFVPRYWNPPSLFNLTSTTHFDLESLIFSWGTGGIGSAIYEAVLNLKHRKMAPEEQKRERRWLHMFSLLSTPAIFLVLIFFTGLNPIYSLSAALFVGGVAAVACRPDLGWNTLVGGLLFTGLYFVLFALIEAASPSFVDAWNLSALSGILVIGVPLEELMFAFTFGMMWSGVYEHIRYYAIRKTN